MATVVFVLNLSALAPQLAKASVNSIGTDSVDLASYDLDAIRFQVSKTPRGILLKPDPGASEGLVLAQPRIESKKFDVLRVRVETPSPSHEQFVFWRSREDPGGPSQRILPIGSIGDTCIDLRKIREWRGTVHEIGVGFRPLYQVIGNGPELDRTLIKTWRLEQFSLSSALCLFTTNRLTGEPWAGSSINSVRVPPELRPELPNTLLAALGLGIFLALVAIFGRKRSRARWSLIAIIILLCISAVPWTYRLSFRAIDSSVKFSGLSSGMRLKQLPDGELYSLTKIALSKLAADASGAPVAVISDSRYLRHRAMYHLLPLASWPAWELGSWVSRGDVILIYGAPNIQLTGTTHNKVLVGRHGRYPVRVIAEEEHGFVVEVRRGRQ